MLRYSCEANAAQLESWMCGSCHGTRKQAPDGDGPVDACEATNSGIEDDAIEFWHFSGGEQTLGKILH